MKGQRTRTFGDCSNCTRHVLTGGMDGKRLLSRRLRLRRLRMQGVLFGFKLLQVQLQRNLREVRNTLRNFLFVNGNKRSSSVCFDGGQKCIV